MLKNYFVIAWRNLLRRKFYSAINIFGLSAGIAFVLLIGGYVWNELQVNKSISNEDRIFLFQSKSKNHESGLVSTAAPEPLPELLNIQFPGLVANYYRWLWKNTVVSNGDKYFRENIQFGDTTLINMFGFPLLYGNANTVFKNPDAVVITEEKALKIFYTTNAVGKILTVENNKGIKHNFIVTGVLKNIPPTSVNTITAADKLSINSIFISLSVVKKFYGEDDNQSWDTYRTAYIKLNKGITKDDLSKPVQQLIKLNTSKDVQDDLQINLIPLPDYYLDANNSSIRKLIYTVSFTALFILLMAIVNFINISIGNSTSRLKEIGLRKVFGGGKKQLVFQFLIESFIIVFVAVCFSLILYQILQPVFSSLIGKTIPSLFSFPFYFAGILSLFIIIVALLAGLYPAIVLSSTKITESVKGKVQSLNENLSLKKLLVAFQFFVAIVVFISAIIIARQVSYITNTDLGFAKEQVLNVPLPRNWTKDGVKRMEIIRDELIKTPGVMQASISFTIPNRNSSANSGFYRLGQDSSMAVAPFGIVCDENYAATFKIPVLAGQFFNAANPSYDSSAVVINESLVKALGWKSANEATGKILNNTEDNKRYTVCGVVKDFHFESKHETIKPLAFFDVLQNNFYRFISIKIKPGNIEETIKNIQKKWDVLLPGEPFDYSFMDETLQMIYKQELQLKKATYIATMLALIIVLLGIVGIISLAVSKRNKEIGIRKVLGASVFNIVLLFIKDVFILIVIAALIACPAAYFIMRLWLDNYAYRIEIGAGAFIIVFTNIAAITALLICIQTIKAAIANPVKSLRTE